MNLLRPNEWPGRMEACMEVMESNYADWNEVAGTNVRCAASGNSFWMPKDHITATYTIHCTTQS
jgi:hypothetical protein